MPTIAVLNTELAELFASLLEVEGEIMQVIARPSSTSEVIISGVTLGDVKVASNLIIEDLTDGKDNVGLAPLIKACTHHGKVERGTFSVQILWNYDAPE